MLGISLSLELFRYLLESFEKIYQRNFSSLYFHTQSMLFSDRGIFSNELGFKKKHTGDMTFQTFHFFPPHKIACQTAT